MAHASSLIALLLYTADSGTYWCAVEIGSRASNSDKRKYLNLKVQKDPDLFVLNSSVSAEEGDTVSIQCFYSHQNQQKTKRWCRIKERSCYEAGKTSSQNSSILITDDRKRSFTVEMSGLRLSDSGWFFCSAGDLQVPVHLTVARAKAVSETDEIDSPPPKDFGNSLNTTKNTEGVQEESSEQNNSVLTLVWIALPLLLLLALALVLWRIVQKCKKGADVRSRAQSDGGVAYDIVYFKKTTDKEQISIRCPPEQDVIYNYMRRGALETSGPGQLQMWKIDIAQVVCTSVCYTQVDCNQMLEKKSLLRGQEVITTESLREDENANVSLLDAQVG
ncbi:hypothetical protein DNTS_025637 [Danionella cerebrum]|nr:hypothetical protein DNTS_025637 [Danionella translucida]